MTLALACGCKAPLEEGSAISATGDPVATAEARLSPNADGSLRLATENEADKAISGVTTVEAAVSTRSGAATASTTPVEVGTLRASKAVFQVNGISDCTKYFDTAGPAPCTNPELPTPNPGPLPGPAPTPTVAATTTPTADDLKQEIVLYPGMSCGRNYEKIVWQKGFDVRIAATVDHLAQVAEVQYDVFSAYKENDSLKSSNSANAFALGKRFLTPVSGWSIGEGTATLKDGTTLKLAKVRIEWNTSEDPAKPAGGACTL